jgi:pimeloyl-ACP methyl ester carboxylesterase
MMLYDDVEGQAGAFDKISPERQQRWTVNARTLGPMFAGLQIAPDQLTCDRIRSISVPTLVVRGENTIPFQRASAKAFKRCLPPGSRSAVILNVAHMWASNTETAGMVILEFLAGR